MIATPKAARAEGTLDAMDVKPVTLEGAGVRMEPLTEAHESALLAILDPALTQWFPKPMQTREDVRGYIAEALAWRKAGTALPFATVSRADGALAGATRFANIDRANRRAEIGWTLVARPFQRSAVNTEAKLLMLTHAFEA